MYSMALARKEQITLDTAACDSSFFVRNADGSVVSLLNDELPASPRSPRQGSHSDDDDTPCATPPPELPFFPSLKVHHTEAPHGLRLPSLDTIASHLGFTTTQLTPPATPITPSNQVSSNQFYLSPITPCSTAPSSPKSSSADLFEGVSVGQQKDTPRRHTCQFEGCGRKFTTSGHLSRHYRVHTGEKNFPCSFPGCNSRFSRQDNMMQHLRTHTNVRSRSNKRRLGLSQAAMEVHAPCFPYSPHSPHYMGSRPMMSPYSVPESPSMPHTHNRYRTHSYSGYGPLSNAYAN